MLWIIKYDVKEILDVIIFDLMEVSMGFDIVISFKIFVSCIILRFVFGVEWKISFFYGFVFFDLINLFISWV